MVGVGNDLIYVQKISEGTFENIGEPIVKNVKGFST